MRKRPITTVFASILLVLGVGGAPVAASANSLPSKAISCSRPGVVRPVGSSYQTCRKWHGSLVWRPSSQKDITAYLTARTAPSSTATCFQWIYDSPTNYYTAHGKPTFTRLPYAIDSVASIVPMGEADSGAKVNTTTGAGAHVMPTDHSSPAFTTRQPQPTYAVADGTLVTVDYGAGRWQTDTPGTRLDDYSLTFQFSANFFLRMTHFTTLAPDLLAAIGPLTDGRAKTVKIPVAAGTYLGTTSGAPYLGTTDFWAIDFDAPSAAPTSTLRLYNPCENHSVDPYQFFAEPYRSQMYAKLPNRPEPRAGQYNFDAMGGLFGNWWKESDLIDGKAQAEASFAFFLDNYDPSVVLVGNRTTTTVDIVTGIDPAKVAVGSEPIAVTLRDKRGNSDAAFQTGMMLVQLVTPTRVKVQVFPNATPTDSIAFDANAMFFVR